MSNMALLRRCWQHRRRLRSHLIMLVLAALLPLVLFSICMIIGFAQGERRTAERGMRETARALALAVDREVGEVHAALGILSLSRPLAAGDLAGFYQQCLEALRFLPYDAWITLSDLQGQVLLNTQVPYGTPVPGQAQSDAVRRITATGRPGQSDLFVDAVTHHPLVSIAVPVFRDGQVHAVLNLTRQAETWGRIFSEQRLPPGWLGGINDRQQIILATTPGIERFIGEPVTPRMAERSAVAEEGWFPNISKDGTPVYSVFSRARSTGWTVVLNAPASAIDAPLRRSLLLVVSGGLVLSAVALGLAVGLGKRIAAPIKELVAATQALSQGEPVCIDPSCTVQEVQDVAAALQDAAALLYQREASLHEQRERLHVTLASIGDAVMATDSHGRVTFMNPVAEALTGWPEAEALGQDITAVLQIINEYTRQVVEHPIAEVIRAGTVVGLANHTLLIARDGVEHPIDDSGAPMRDPQGRLVGVVLVFRDITERRRAEAEVEQRRRETEMLAELAQSLSASLDLDTVLQRVVAGAQELCGSERAFITLREPGSDVLVGRYEVGAPHMAYAGLRIEPGKGLGGQVLRTGRPWRTENYAADTRFSKEYMVGARAGGNLATVAVPILIGGRVEGVFYASNPSARPFTDQDEEILVRLAAHAAIAIQNAQLYQQAQAELAERQKAEAALAQAAAELEQRVQERTAALRHEMAERQRLEREAQRSEHFALLGRLAAGVSHEIRNPLGAIFLHVDLLEEELRAPSPDSPAELAQAVAEIKTQLARLEDLVQDYLSLVRVAQIERTPHDFGAAVQGWAVEWQGLAAGREVTIQVAGLADLGAVAFHPNTLQRALLNLIQNALDAMPQGGTITVAGRGTATQVRLQVQDMGGGISAERLGHIFEPLYTTKPGGTGLGLYIVQEILAAHGGQILVESVEGQGTTFTLILPRAVVDTPPEPLRPV